MLTHFRLLIASDFEQCNTICWEMFLDLIINYLSNSIKFSNENYLIFLWKLLSSFIWTVYLSSTETKEIINLLRHTEDLSCDLISRRKILTYFRRPILRCSAKIWTWKTFKNIFNINLYKKSFCLSPSVQKKYEKFNVYSLSLCWPKLLNVRTTYDKVHLFESRKAWTKFIHFVTHINIKLSF